jgi:H+/Cl- antiporter ClcA
LTHLLHPIGQMTGDYGLVLPLMIANMSALALARHWRHIPVYEAYWLKITSTYPTEAARLTRPTTSRCLVWLSI